MKTKPDYAKQRGQALVEFALTLPVLLFVILAIVDYGRVLYVYSNAAYNLRQATRNANLLGTGSVNSYVDCDLIQGTANRIQFATINDIDVLYQNTVGKTESTNPTDFPANYVEGYYDFSCDNDDTNPDGTAITQLIGAGDVQTGDILTVRVDTRIGFITPFLSNIYSGLDVNFQSQRTIVAGIAISGIDSDKCAGYAEPHNWDSDNDGNCDGWELEWFGCMAASAPNDTSQAIDSWDANFNDTNCAIETRTAADGSSVANAIIPNLDEYDATDDPDGDNASNGSEEAQGTCPITGNPAFTNCNDSDGDGLADGEELSQWSTNPSGEDVAPSDGIPDGYDTDGDGLSDGEEVPNGFRFTDPTFPNYGPSNPQARDADGDGVIDGLDSDDDGIGDGIEVLDHRSSPVHVHTDGIVWDDPAVQDIIINDETMDVTQIGDGLSDADEINGFTVSTAINVDIVPPIETSGAEITSIAVATNPTLVDTDGDGIHDNCELNPGAANANTDQVCSAQGFSHTNATDPTQADSDGDGIDDGVEVYTLSTEAVRAGHVFLPTHRDYDDDLVFDATERDEYTDPQDANSDRLGEDIFYDNFIDLAGNTVSFYCYDRLDDYTEIVVYDTNASGLDRVSDSNPDVSVVNLVEIPDGDGAIESIDGYDTEYDGVNDCDELYLLGTDPNDWDSDDDGVSDADDPAPNDDTRTTLGTDSDKDGLDDQWEKDNFDFTGSPYPNFIDAPPSASPYTDTDGNPVTHSFDPDPDNDGCDNLCEFRRNLDPLDPDTDDDDLLDGQEPLLNTDPRFKDTDGDGLNDDCEVDPLNTTGVSDCSTYDNINYGITNPRDPDTDGDGLTDAQELYPNTISGYTITYGTMNPNDTDSDNDGLTDREEAIPTHPSNTITHPFGPTNPNSDNTDGPPTNPADEADLSGDTWTDLDEITLYNTNPNEPDTDGDGIRDDVEFNLSTIFDAQDSYANYGSQPWQAPTGAPDGIPDGRDTDRDGLTDGQEYFGIQNYNLEFCGGTQTINIDGYRDNPFNGLNPTQWDSDFDSVDWDLDGVEDAQADTTGDGVLDGQDLFLSDGLEAASYTVPAASIVSIHPDGKNTNPINFDTDGDDADIQGSQIRFGDADELNDESLDTDPLCSNQPDDVDSDLDGINNQDELDGTQNTEAESWNGEPTNPFDADSDDDGLQDGQEVLGGVDGFDGGFTFTATYTDVDGNSVTIPSSLRYTDPNNPDTDGDGVPDGAEATGDHTGTAYAGTAFAGTKTDPEDADTDGDGVSDGAELLLGYNPMDGTAEDTRLDAIAPDATQVRAIINAYNDVQAATDFNSSCAFTEYNLPPPPDAGAEWNPAIARALCVANLSSVPVTSPPIDDVYYITLFFGATDYTDISDLFAATADGQSEIVTEYTSGSEGYDVRVTPAYLVETLIWDTDIDVIQTP